MTTQAENAATVATPVAAASVVTPAAYNSLVAAARLQDIRLLKSEFTLDPAGIGTEENWKLTHTCDIQHVEFSDNHLFNFIEATAFCKIKHKRVVSIRCRYLVMYEVQGSPEQTAIEAFAKRVARFAAYPYFRAHVAEMGSQAGLRLPPLPIIKEVKVIPKVSGDVGALGEKQK